MEYRKYKEKIYLRLDPGDEIIACLIQLCKTEGVKAASVQGIGGCDAVEMGIFDPQAKRYITHEQQGMLEMVSLDGNVSVYEGQPYIHAHASFAYHDEDGRAQTLSGHLLSARIGLTGEIVLTTAELPLTREYIDELGIRIWKFEE